MKLKSKKIFLLIMILATQNISFITERKKALTNHKKHLFDIEGHRGCRGLMPENTIPAFIEALRIGVNTLEMDVVVSADGKLVVSHDPYMSSEFCTTPDGKEILPGEDSIKYNIFRMNYDEIRKFDCGKKIHLRFPDQKKLTTYKPLLSEVIDRVEQYVIWNNLNPVTYNIETKCTVAGDGIYNPAPDVLAESLYNLIKQKNIFKRVIFQSFDVRTLQYIKHKNPASKISLLTENNNDFTGQIAQLGFTPDIYSPDYHSVNSEMVSALHINKIRLIPWTINDSTAMYELYKLGVDGLITDYPNIAIPLINKAIKDNQGVTY